MPIDAHRRRRANAELVRKSAALARLRSSKRQMTIDELFALHSDLDVLALDAEAELAERVRGRRRGPDRRADTQARRFADAHRRSHRYSRSRSPATPTSRLAPTGTSLTGSAWSTGRSQASRTGRSVGHLRSVAARYESGRREARSSLYQKKPRALKSVGALNPERRFPRFSGSPRLPRPSRGPVCAGSGRANGPEGPTQASYRGPTRASYRGPKAQRPKGPKDQ